jgi:CheY-like chemotaxis protein
MEAKIFRALIVDDSPVCLKQLGKIMADLGYATDLFFDGEQAFEHLSNYREILTYDVIITDLHMPVLGGIQFIRQCRELLGVNIPIAVVSSFGSSKAAEVMQAGADLFLDKPVNRKQIADIFSSFSDTVCGSGQVYAESSKRLNIVASSTQSTRPVLCKITQEMIGYMEQEAERTSLRASGKK